jgi:glycosyltransferase involved in cell wall biosynthesis
LADPALRERMGRAGRRRVERLFSWERVVAMHEQVYADVVAGVEQGALSSTVGAARSTR